jgi:hypothetical protein
MSFDIGGTSDPRKHPSETLSHTVWSVAEGRQEAEADGAATLATEVASLNKEIRQVLSRPQKWVTQIRDLGTAELRLVEPVLVVIEEYPEEESVIARFPELEAFGEGITEAEALLCLKNDIRSLYDDLNNTPENELGTLPQSWLRVLRQLIQEA